MIIQAGLSLQDFQDIYKFAFASHVYSIAIIQGFAVAGVQHWEAADSWGREAQDKTGIWAERKSARSKKENVWWICS